MPDEFNPYHIWLGIPPEDQPPHHYRLLGVKAFETNPDVLESAADQRMVHVRSFQGGKHSAESQKLLNELAAARLCLLNPENRQAYDRELRGKLAADQPPKAPPRPAATRPLAVARPLTAQPAGAPTVPLGFDPFEQASPRRSSKQRHSRGSPAIYAAAGVGLVAAVALVWVAIGNGDADNQPLAAQPSSAAGLWELDVAAQSRTGFGSFGNNLAAKPSPPPWRRGACGRFDGNNPFSRRSRSAERA